MYYGHSSFYVIRHAGTRQRLVFFALSLLCMFNSAGATEDIVENLVCSNNTTLMCRDILQMSCETYRCPTTTDGNDNTVISVEIRDTAQKQPSAILEVKGGDYKRLREGGRIHHTKMGYIIGYRECVSSPSEVCYIFHNDLPGGIIYGWKHNITVNTGSQLPLGERCTFFGCLVYCNIESCERMRRNFLEENVTILATCPDQLGRSIENGIVSYTRDLTDEGEYVEGTTVEVSCDEGYRSGGDITCQNVGNWSSSSLTNCTIVDCGTPPLLLNGDTLHEPFNTTYGSIVTYRCNSLYVFSETSSDNHTCLLSGDWSDETITCLATCPDLGNTTENGNVSYTRDPTEQGRYVENTTVTVSCDEGYRGGGNITCQNDGNWSSSILPSCTSIAGIESRLWEHRHLLIVVSIVSLLVGLLCLIAVILYRYCCSNQNDKVRLHKEFYDDTTCS